MSIDRNELDKLYKLAYNATKYKHGYCRKYIFRLLSGKIDNSKCNNCVKYKDGCDKEIPLPKDSEYLSMLDPGIVIELINIYLIHMKTRYLD